MGVPARLSRHVVTLHGFVPRENVLEASRQHMVDAGLAVGRWRSFIETELRIPFRLVQRLLEHIVLTPELQHFGLERRTVVSAADFFK